MLKIAELKQETDQEWAKDRYYEYLTSLMVGLVLDAQWYMGRYEMFDDAGCEEMKYIVSKPLTETVRKLVVLETRRRMLKKGVEGSVTDEMIQSAKDFPFEELYEFKRNFAKCPFHDDKSPSMSLKNNRVKCWSCNKSWDTIQFVMDKDGLSFREAVLRLQ